jgi:hypothetical protein
MTAALERALLRVGEYLVDRACRGLPRKTRKDRYREWTAELPAILHDPEVRFAPRRAVRMLAYAADTLRGAARIPGRPRRRPPAPMALVLGLLFVSGLAVTVWDSWDTARAPGHWVNYLTLAWSLCLAAWPVGQYFRSTARATHVLFYGGLLAGMVVNIWNAVQAPADWVGYFVAACFFSVILLTLWFMRRLGRRDGPSARPGPAR